MKKSEFIQTRRKDIANRIIAFVLMTLMLVTFVPINGVVTEAEESGSGTRATTQRTIGILFDNSGSMYQEDAWCRAIYAMEVFASMANEGDTILIYPMHEITIKDEGTTYTSDNPMIIAGGTSDASKIRQIYTDQPGETPIESVEAAYNDMMTRSGDEKWLVILTDGDEFQEDEVALDDTEGTLSTLLTEYNNDLNLLYLGIGSQAVKPTISGSCKHDSQKAEDSADVLSMLTDMCNLIYGRDLLPDIDTDSNTVAFDLSMNKLILFVQGSDIENLKLVDADGNEVADPTITYTPSYSTAGQGKKSSYYSGMKSDTSLSGAIVIYGGDSGETISAGTYTLSYSGKATSAEIYYEPNVKISALLVNDEGVNVTDLGGEVYAGTYTLQFGLTDEFGNLTDSSLLGDREFTITYTKNDEEKTQTASQNGSIDIELAAGDTLDVDVTGTYLNGYTVSTESDSSWGFPIDCVEAPFELSVVLTGGASSYTVPAFEESAVYSLEVLYNGTALTGDALAAANIKVSFADDNKADYTCELSDDGSSYVIALTYPGGDANALTAGDYTMTVTAEYTDEYDATRSTGSQTEFSVEEYSYSIEASIDADGYYTFSDLKDGEAVVVNVTTEDGSPLSAEEMEQASLQFTIDGETTGVSSIETDAENSCFLVYLDADALSSGNHKIAAVATAYDELGNVVDSPEVTDKFELQAYPLWLRILVICLIILLILALIWAFMNQKVLPKDIYVDSDTEFRVRSKKVDDDARASYSRNKKNGSVTIEAPDSPTNPNASGCGLTLTLEAVDPRRVKSAKRGVRVVSASGISPDGIKNVSIGNASFIQQKNTFRFINDSDPDKDTEQMDEILHDGAAIEMSGKVNNPTGGQSAVRFNAVLKFR